MCIEIKIKDKVTEDIDFKILLRKQNFSTVNFYGSKYVFFSNVFFIQMEYQKAYDAEWRLLSVNSTS